MNSSPVVMAMTADNLVGRMLNRITMYRLMLYYAAALLAAGLGLSFFGWGPGDPVALALSSALVLAVCWATNRLFARLLRIPVNRESVYITALLLALILPPAALGDLMGLAGLVLASGVAIASKFVLAIGRKHVFNPVALGVAASAFILDQPATWWVGGNLTLLPLVLLGGLLVVRKLRRFDMVGCYVLANLAVILATTAPALVGEAATQSLLYTPLLFLGFAMLTEPMTAPQARQPRMLYGALVGALMAPDLHLGAFYLTPEIALLLGNAFAFCVSPKGRFKLTLLARETGSASAGLGIEALSRRVHPKARGRTTMVEPKIVDAPGYGGVARSLHWLVFAVVLVLFALAWTMPGVRPQNAGSELIDLHVSLGVLIMPLALLRLVWRASHPVPLLRDTAPRWQQQAAEATHWLLYGLLFLLPLLGWCAANARGVQVSFFGFFTLPTLLGADPSLAAILGSLHQPGAYVLLGVVGLHAAAALYHHFVLRDATLRRMLPP